MKICLTGWKPSFKRTMKKFFILTVFLFAFFPGVNAQINGIFNVRDFGASGGKNILATEAIQQAIDRCAGSGGGKVYFPAGEYLSGPLTLKSNVNLYLESGATLFASHNMADYPADPNYKADQQTETPFKSVFLRAENLENIAITGLGTIDGQAEQVWQPLAEIDQFIEKETENARLSGIPIERAYQKDPKVRLIYLMFCSKVNIQGVTIKNSPDWNLHLGRCRDVKINGITILSSLTLGVNSDGIDIDACINVLVSGCIIATGDDAICLKTTKVNGKIESCENVIVDHCICTSSSTALKLGTESHGDFKNILFSNCIIPNSNRGLSIVVRDGANVNNVKFTNIVLHCSRKHFNWWGNGDPIWLVVLKRNKDSRVGRIQDVVFENITASAEGTSKLEGFEGSPLENIQIRNVKIEMNPESLSDKRATHGFIAHDVNRLSISDFDLVWNEQLTEPRWQSAFRFENIEDLRLGAISCRQASGKENPAIQLVNVKNGIAERCYAYPSTKTYFEISGNKTQNLIFRDNYLKNARIAFVQNDNVNISEVNFETPKIRNND